MPCHIRQSRIFHRRNWTDFHATDALHTKETKTEDYVMNYGIGYQGSKSRIAEGIVAQLPSGRRFVDLFAGGCAIVHCAMLSGKYEKILCNDLYPHGSNLFRQALEGEFNKPEYLRWVSREEFMAKKDTDDFVRLVFSFGNNGTTYMYNKELEPLKKAFHYAVVYDDWTYLEQYAKDNNWKEGLLDTMKKSVEGIGNLEQRRLASERQMRTDGLQQSNQTVLVHLLRKKRLDEIDERRLALNKQATISGLQQPSGRILPNLTRKQRLDEINERRLKITKPAYNSGVIGLPHNLL